MLASIVKFIAFYFIGNRISDAKQDLREIKDNAADYAESRVSFIRHNVADDLQRIVNSFIGFLVMFAAIIFCGLLGLMWLFAVAWQSPDRNLILGIAMLVPLCVSGIIFIVIKASWKNKPLLEETSELIAKDWQAFRLGLNDTADTTEKTNR